MICLSLAIFNPTINTLLLTVQQNSLLELQKIHLETSYYDRCFLCVLCVLFTPKHWVLGICVRGWDETLSLDLFGVQ